jgi:hypothetical protein
MVTHVACEVTVLQALTRAFARKGMPERRRNNISIFKWLDTAASIV